MRAAGGLSNQQAGDPTPLTYTDGVLALTASVTALALLVWEFTADPSCTFHMEAWDVRHTQALAQRTPHVDQRSSGKRQNAESILTRLKRLIKTN
jgi:hypothetical protein